MGKDVQSTLRLIKHFQVCVLISSSSQPREADIVAPTFQKKKQKLREIE